MAASSPAKPRCTTAHRWIASIVRMPSAVSTCPTLRHSAQACDQLVQFGEELRGRFGHHPEEILRRHAIRLCVPALGATRLCTRVCERDRMDIFRPSERPWLVRQ